MSKKQKPLKIEIEVPDSKYLLHIANAYGLVSQYRTANKVPHEKMEAWLLRLVVEGCNALYNFHNQQLLAQQKKAEEASATATETEEGAPAAEQEAGDNE
jgi:hypothetical protein